MKVLGNTSSRRLAEIKAHIESVGTVCLLEGRHAASEKRKEILGLFVGKILEALDVTPRQNQHVARTIRKGIQNQEAEGGHRNDAG